MLRALRPALPQLSTAALCNLVWALGKLARLQADRTKAGDGWIAGPVGADLLSLTSAALGQLGQRRARLAPEEVVGVAVAAAAHAEWAGELPAGELAALREACDALLAADRVPWLELGPLAAAAGRLRWQERGFVDRLAARIQPLAGALATHVEVSNCKETCLAVGRGVLGRPPMLAALRG